MTSFRTIIFVKNFQYCSDCKMNGPMFCNPLKNVWFSNQEKFDGKSQSIFTHHCGILVTKSSTQQGEKYASKKFLIQNFKVMKHVRVYDVILHPLMHSVIIKHYNIPYLALTLSSGSDTIQKFYFGPQYYHIKNEFQLEISALFIWRKKNLSI